MSLTQPGAPYDLHPGTTPGLRPVFRDPIVEEVRVARDAYAKSFEYDPAAIVADLQARETGHQDLLVSFQPKRLTE
jgi:hypothetical protein